MKQKQFNQVKAFRFRRFTYKAYGAFNSMYKPVNIGVVMSLVFSLAQATPASAQESISNSGEKLTEKELSEVTVTASRVEMAANQASKIVTIITKDEIDRAAIKSIQDILVYAASIDIIQRGGHGVQADISIRGGSFDQTAILLNGINLSNPQTGHYSFDIPINLSDIKHIEIIHGPASIIYGASAFSGGINIITNTDTSPKAFTTMEAGSHNSYRLEGKGSLKTAQSTNQLSVGYKASNGYIPNSDYNIFNALWQTQLNVDESKINIQLGYNQKDYGANTFYTPDYPNQYDKTSSYLVSIKGETGTKLKFKPQVYWNRHNDNFQLFRDGTLNLPPWYVGHNYHQSDVYGANVNLQYTSNLGITSFGSEFRNEGIYSNVLGHLLDTPIGRFTKSDNRTNISHALEHNILLQKFTITLGVLANYNTIFSKEYKLFPSANVAYSISDELRIFTSWNTATRMPTFTDLYYTTDTHIGNSNLLPEDSEAFELGLKYNTPFMNAYLTGYLMKGKNMIDWIKESPDEKWTSRNITQIDKQGIEFSSRFRLNKMIPSLHPKTSLQIGYARLNQDHSSGELISNYSLNYLRDKFTTVLNHQVYKNITANWAFRWQKRMGTYIKYEDLKPTTVESYPAFSTLDLRVNWEVQSFDIYMDINNLYDTHFFDMGNVPQAGFWFSLGFNYTLK